MTYVDFHCHLDWKSFDSDRDKLISDMKKQNIIAVSNTLNRENFEYTKNLYKNYDNVKVCPGLYPTDAVEINEREFTDYLEYIKSIKDEIIAIGEVGLDGKEITEPEQLELQEKRFRKLIELAIEIDKPLIIHTRKREQRTLEIIREYVEKNNFRKFNLHCFCGKKKLIKDIKELRIYCSIPLIVKNTQQFQTLVQELPTSQILVETDSPFLHPDKVRNSPLSVPLIYEEISKIKGYDKKEIENIIYRNFMKLTL